ncbi:MAG: RecX family transcriptional regulator [Nitrospira sp.]|nr:RecX family transcriptional regulator [Nitrospira sp.]
MREARKSGRIGDGQKEQARPCTTPTSLDEVIRLAVRFLALRDRTVAQVERFLLSRGIASSSIEPTICRLTDLRYLDDLAYAQRWVERRLATKPMGQERLKAELQAKGISDGLADGVLTEIFRAHGEEVFASRAMQALSRQGKRLAPVHIARFLHQRGFSDEVIDRMMMEFKRNEDVVHEGE